MIIYANRHAKRMFGFDDHEVLDFNVSALVPETFRAVQLGILTNQRCNYVQGFLFSEPVPLKDYELVLASSFKK